MIPPFDPVTGYLPPGEHEATWQEIVERFGTTGWRRELLRGLQLALESLAKAGCQRAYIDGSFVTSAERPNDFDGCWDTDGVDFDLLDETLLMFENRRAAQKAKFGGELFLSDTLADGDGRLFLEFFQQDRDGIPKGIVVIDLRHL
jgi:hypothetical protein